MRWIGALLVIGAIAMAAVGCGSSDNESSASGTGGSGSGESSTAASATSGDGGESSTATTSNPLLPASYIKQVDEICSVEHGRMQATAEAYDEFEEAGKSLGAGGARGRSEVMLEVLQQTINRVGRILLKEPIEHEQEARAFLLEFQDVVHTNSGVPFKEAEQLERKFTRASEMANELGITACALD